MRGYARARASQRLRAEIGTPGSHSKVINLKELGADETYQSRGSKIIKMKEVEYDDEDIIRQTAEVRWLAVELPSGLAKLSEVWIVAAAGPITHMQATQK